MAISKVNFNSLNLTPTASKTVVFNSNNNGIEAGDVGGALVLISEQTASSSSTISFTSGIDSTYKEYQVHFINCHPATNDVNLQFNASVDSGSNYNVTKTTTFFAARHRENDSATNLEYVTNRDLAQSTDFNKLNYDTGNQNDEDVCGILHLFDPSSTTFVKHFISRAIGNGQAEDCHDSYTAGYFNTTSAIDAIQFKFGSGNIDAGIFKLYGVT